MTRSTTAVYVGKTLIGAVSGFSNASWLHLSWWLEFSQPMDEETAGHALQRSGLSANKAAELLQQDNRLIKNRFRKFAHVFGKAARDTATDPGALRCLKKNSSSAKESGGRT